MTDSPVESADLTAVKAQFLEAEKRLRELAQGAVELTRASVLLKKARMGLTDGAEGLRDLSSRLGEYIGTLSDISSQLAELTEALRGTSGGVDTARLDRLDARLGAVHTELERIATLSPSRQDDGTLANATADLVAVSKELSQRAEELAKAPRPLPALDGLDARLEAIEQSLKNAATRSGLDPSAELTASVAALDRITTELSETAKSLPRLAAAGPDGEIARVLRQLEDTQQALSRLAQRGAERGDEAAQLDLAPGVEESLMALAQDIYAKEVTMVDTLAELRRALGRDLRRTEEALERRIAPATDPHGLETDIAAIRRMLWVVLAVLIGGFALILAV